jgi:hypothetical protein
MDDARMKSSIARSIARPIARSIVGSGDGGSKSIQQQLLEVLFSNSELGGMWLPFVQESVFSDLAGTTVIEADGFVRRINDLSGNDTHFTQSIDLRRPTWSSGRLVSDGTSDAMVTGTIDYSGKNKVTAIAAYARTGTASGTIFEHGSNVSNTFAMFSPASPGDNHTFRARGTSDSQAVSASDYASPQEMAIYSGVGGNGIRTYLACNNTAIAVANSTNPTAWVASQTIKLFARGQTSVFFAGELAGLIIVVDELPQWKIDRAVSLLSQASGQTPIPDRAAKRLRDSMYSWWSYPLIAETAVDTYVGTTNDAAEVLIRGVNTGTTAVLSTQTKDDHIPPALLSIPGKMPLAFWHDRSGTSLFWKRGTVEGDFTTLGTTQEKAGGGAIDYTRAMYIPETDEIYVWSRRNNSTWCYFRSTDDGVTFDDPVVFVDIETTGQSYMSFAELGDGLVRFSVYTHPTAVAAIQAIYYGVIDFTTGNVTKADGTLVGNINAAIPEIPFTLDELDKCFDADDEVDVNTVRMFEVGNGPQPEITFCVWDDAEAESTREYRYVYWDGTAWVMRDLGLSGVVFGYLSAVGYHGGVTIPKDTTGHTFILSREESGQWFVERWASTDSGVNFSQTLIRSGIATKLIRPISYSGKNKLAIVEAYQYDSTFTGWQSDVLLLENNR